jgi:hypothetical protein
MQLVDQLTEVSMGPFEEVAYQRWLRQHQRTNTIRFALEMERLQILHLSPKASAQLVADLPSVRCRVEYYLELAERQLPKGSPKPRVSTLGTLKSMIRLKGREAIG